MIAWRAGASVQDVDALVGAWRAEEAGMPLLVPVALCLIVVLIALLPPVDGDLLDPRGP